MRKLPYILATICMTACMVASCTKSESSSTQSGSSSSIVDGEWHIVSVGELEDGAVDVYLSFSDGAFELYQKTGTMERYQVYYGTFTISGDIMDGVYSDGESWGSSYSVAVDGSTLTMTAQNGSGEISIYTSETIPEDVRDNAVVPPALRSAGEDTGSFERFL